MLTLVPPAPPKNTLPDNFAEFPRTLGEARSDITEKAKDWSPRDMLIGMLRQIDSGEWDPDTVVVAWLEQDGDVAGYNSAGNGSSFEVIGILERTKSRMMAAIDSANE